MTNLGTAAAWLVLVAFYLFLAGGPDPVEVTAAMVCASIGAALAAGLGYVARKRFSFRVPAKAVFAPLAALLSETWRVGRSLVATLFTGTDRDGHRGAFVRQPFEPGGDDPASAGRRAAALIGLSLAPRTVVVRGERSETLILHALPPKPAGADRRWPL